VRGALGFCLAFAALWIVAPDVNPVRIGIAAAILSLAVMLIVASQDE
jgi:hypothetical protein